jgi:SNF family Na+-dependent transporter
MVLGVGFGMVIISGIVCIYYNVIIAWTLYYFVQSFTWDLPWSHCNNTWNTEHCVDRRSQNETFVINASVKARSPSEEFYE